MYVFVRGNAAHMATLPGRGWLRKHAAINHEATVMSLLRGGRCGRRQVRAARTVLLSVDRGCNFCWLLLWPSHACYFESFQICKAMARNSLVCSRKRNIISPPSFVVIEYTNSDDSWSKLTLISTWTSSLLDYLCFTVFVYNHYTHKQKN